MGLIQRLLRREQRAVATIKSSDPYLSQWFGNRSGTGAYVNPHDASGLAVAHACVGLISSTLASLPLNLHRRIDDGGREVARDHPLHGVLHDMADQWATAFETRESLIADLLVFGNALAEIDWNGRGQCVGLKYVPWSFVTVEGVNETKPRYIIQDGTRRRVLLADEALHLRYRLANDRLVGLSPIQLARASFNLALEQESQAHKAAQRAFRPSGVLSLAHQIGASEKTDILDVLGEKAASTSDTGGVLVLDGGATWAPTSFTARDAEFLESRKLSDLAIARIFHVPPTAIGITDNATYSNVYGENQAFVSRCLAPLAKRIEAAMNAALLPESSRATFYVEHDMSGLLRADVEGRYAAYASAVQNGIMTRAEIRERENLPKITGTDQLLQPLNLTGVKNAADVE